MPLMAPSSTSWRARGRRSACSLPNRMGYYYCIRFIAFLNSALRSPEAPSSTRWLRSVRARIGLVRPGARKDLPAARKGRARGGPWTACRGAPKVARLGAGKPAEWKRFAPALDGRQDEHRGRQRRISEARAEETASTHSASAPVATRESLKGQPGTKQANDMIM